MTQLTLDDYENGVRRGDRALLGQAISLVESSRPEHRDLALELLARLLPATGNSWRVGISGVPGVGKSTFIEALGGTLTAAGHRVAVLAVDPSSQISGGSILGDKTRMNALSTNPAAFVRPSPSRGVLGGVGLHTREAILLCEAAGYDIVLVETVGVGQSELLVSEMVDTFLLLALPLAGDELQGIKRGILEVVDVVAVNKSDGEFTDAAKNARQELQAALHILRGGDNEPGVACCSALHGDGIEDVWALVAKHREHVERSGTLAATRGQQQLHWLWSQIEAQLAIAVRADAKVAAMLPEIEQQVRELRCVPSQAAQRILHTFLGL
ncbi:MAG: methylmalonyl Co-A mutase-associated GTPase MeaB [Planctomycetota bacterium]